MNNPRDITSTDTTLTMSRRRFLGLGALAAAGALFGCGAAVSLVNQLEKVVVERVSVPVRGLAPALEGTTVAQLSDIHLSGLVRTDYVRRVVELTNSLRPDLTLLTGDYVWEDVDAIFELAPIIGRLDARYGVYAALGNHEIWTDPSVVTSGLAEARLPLLRNRGVTLNIGGAPLHVAGLDDGWSGRPDLSAALAGAPSDAPVIMMLHEPDLVDYFASRGRITLQLSGHSHGGQVRSGKDEAYILPRLGQKYDQGLYRVGDTWLYTTRGVGVTRFPVRYNCPPEITLVTLTGA
jgi:predicted MPP superfamily phosphohydrolase